MFDLGFSELVVIAVVLLIVVGPERLPGVARTAGHLFGRMQRYIADVKSDIRREIQIDELKKLQQQTQELDQTFRKEMNEIQSGVREALNPLEETAIAAAAPDTSDAPDTHPPHGRGKPRPYIADTPLVVGAGLAPPVTPDAPSPVEPGKPADPV